VANSADFVAHVLELSKPQARMSSRAMFGGHGIYADGVIVAIVVDDMSERSRAAVDDFFGAVARHLKAEQRP